MAMQSISSSISYRFKYQVFLSFRGSDTRYGFTGNLYKALTDKGIHTFIDDRELQRGDEITSSLIKAIEESRIFIPVFSANYASSSFCLDEIVHIIRCYNEKGRLVLPVFFGVDPSHVRHHRGSYGEALAKHEERFQNNTDNMERLEKWKIALTQAANLSGNHRYSGYEYKLNGKTALNKATDLSIDHCSQRYEYDFIGEIVKYISNKINRVPLHVANYPVGLQSRVQQVKSLLDEGPDDGVRMVGLYGTGGLGKSTLAKAVYNFIADQFECSCFLHNVRENSTQKALKDLQNELLLKTVGMEIKLGDASEGIEIIKERLGRKKILLILDDVDKLKQLQALAGGPGWFGHGSRVIITTRDKQLLTNHEIERKYAVKGLNGTEALELLRWMAFKSNKVPSSYEDMILNRAVLFASSSPLVLEIVGSYLCLIQDILKLSYKALEEEQKSIFLDIACCLKGYRLTEVEDILHAHYGHCIKHHVAVLIKKSLIECSTQYLLTYCDDVTLHDLIEDMAKEIVRQESSKEPGERSRLWCQDDVVHVLHKNTGTCSIEMMYLNCLSMEPMIEWSQKTFKNMTNLKTLIIENDHFSIGPKYLPSSLRVLKWKGCTSESLSSSILCKKFEDMKVLNLDNCEYLTHITDLSGLQNLEKISFQNCNNLITIHDSIGKLSKLEILNAKECIRLESFPPLWLTSLKKLELSGCRSLKNFPELLCEMTNIKDIALYDTSMRELSFSFQNLCELRDLTIQSCKMLRFSSNNAGLLLPTVERLNLRYNNLSDDCLSILLTWFANVKHLDLSDNCDLKILPEGLSECQLLRELLLNNCKSLEQIRGIPPNLREFSAKGCYSLSASTKRMLLSQHLHKDGCTKISFPNGTEGIPDWFEHQSSLPISFWFRKKIPSITCSILIPELLELPDFNLFVNGYECTLSESFFYYSQVLQSEHVFLFDLKLDEQIYENFRNKREFEEHINKALLNKEWIHVELKLKIT